jgi:preprotein translocase subunit SecG
MIIIIIIIIITVITIIVIFIEQSPSSEINSSASCSTNSSHLMYAAGSLPC